MQTVPPVIPALRQRFGEETWGGCVCDGIWRRRSSEKKGECLLRFLRGLKEEEEEAQEEGEMRRDVASAPMRILRSFCGRRAGEVVTKMMMTERGGEM